MCIDQLNSLVFDRKSTPTAHTHQKRSSFILINFFLYLLQFSEIKCHNQSSTEQEFTATIRRPAFYTTSPIIDSDLESKFSLFSNFKHSSYHCRFEFDPSTNNFHMKLTNFEKCGVSEMRSNDNKVCIYD